MIDPLACYSKQELILGLLEGIAICGLSFYGTRGFFGPQFEYQNVAYLIRSVTRDGLMVELPMPRPLCSNESLDSVHLLRI